MESAEVLVVGSGPAGLSIAAELGMHGRRCIVIDISDRGGISPRAKTTNVRTRELMRRWRVAGRLAALSPFGVEYASDAVFATSMKGPELARFKNAMYCAPARDHRYSEHAQWIPQHLVERTLRETALAHPTVEIRQPVRFISLQQDNQGVVATVENGEGKRQEILASYVVGADGARSAVREQLGIAMQGESPLGYHRNYIFRAPGLHDRHALGQAAMYWLVHGRYPSVLAPLDADDLWVFSCSRSVSSDDAAGMIRETLALDVPVEVIAQDDWTAHQLIAEKYGVGRVFLIGDACHLHPPFGGHGMNMGVGDAVDLGWKLAAALAGWAGPSLLGSYEIERHQVHQRVVNESVANHKHLAANFYSPGLDEATEAGHRSRTEVRERILDAKSAEFDSLGLVIGYHYELSPILAREPQDTSIRFPRSEYESSARPGCRAPHLWISEGRERGASLYDHFHATGFTLLATAADAVLSDSVRKALDEASASRVPICFVAPRHPELHALYGAEFALIRPDHHVAWRGDDIYNAMAALHVARGASLTTEKTS